jgi:hypothetical protein
MFTNKGFVATLLLCGLPLFAAAAQAGDLQKAMDTYSVTFNEVTYDGSPFLALTAPDDAYRNGQPFPTLPQCHADGDHSSWDGDVNHPGPGWHDYNGNNKQCGIDFANFELQTRADQICAMAGYKHSTGFVLGLAKAPAYVSVDYAGSLTSVSPSLLADQKIGNNVVGIVKGFQSVTCLKESLIHR